MKLKIQLQHPNAKAPTYATEGAAAFDLYAATVNGAASIGDVVYPGHPVICDTGVAFEAPEGYMLQVRSRSGLAFKHGVEAFHGTIDSDYRGTVQVLLTCAYLDDDEPPVKIKAAGWRDERATHTGAVDTAPNSAPSSGAFYWHSRHWAAPNLHGWNNEWQPCR
jgi:deoxyuridine 5'-triphosphate nucleotidohydrolase